MAESFHLFTLGCKINQYETQAIREALLAQGLREVDDPAAADRIIVNSCAVTDSAVRDLRRALNRFEREAPKADLTVTGCAATALEQDIRDRHPTANILPHHRKRELIGLPAPDAPSFPPFSISDYRRSRPILKVQDGCSHGCSYCIVPLARGPATSRSPEDVSAEMLRLDQKGFRELVIAGVNLGQYRPHPGFDIWDLTELLEQALAKDGHPETRLRFSSLDPGLLNDKALGRFAESGRVLPHLHVSLQSGSSSVLERMGRLHCSPEQVLDFFHRLRKRLPRFAVGADILVGFPGETDAEFEETRAVVKELPLTYAHVFPYSPRPGTRAAERLDHIADDVKKERAALIRRVVAEKKRRFTASLLDCPNLRVLLEKTSPAVGVCEFYIKCRFVRDPQAETCSVAHAKPVSASADELLVEPA